MSPLPVFIDSFSALLPDGLHSPQGVEPWRPDQTPVHDVERSQVIDKPHLNFGKLAFPDKLAFAAACLLLRSYPLVDGKRTGVVIGAPWGSLSTDIRYMQSVVAGFPSPAIFSATLPSSAVAEIAIYFGLKGPNRAISQGLASGLAALELAARAIQFEKADAMIVIAMHALEAQDRPMELLAGTRARPNTVVAFLLTKEKKPGGIGAQFSFLSEPEKTAGKTEESDVYLRHLLNALQRRDSAVIRVALSGWRGQICVEKTNEDYHEE